MACTADKKVRRNDMYSPNNEAYPPQLPTQKEFEDIFTLPFTRKPDPKYNETTLYIFTRLKKKELIKTLVD